MIHESFVPIFSCLLILVMFVGVIGNLLVIYVVLNYGRLKTVTNTYLLHLALSDLVFLTGIPFFISSLMTQAWIFGKFFCKLFFLIQGVNQYTSIMILALLSFDRYLAVCYSYRSVAWRKRCNPNLLLTLSWLTSFMLMLPIILFTTLETNKFDSSVQCVIVMPYLDARLFYNIFFTYTLTFTFILPISFMTYFYICIVKQLKHKVSQQHRRSRSSKQTRRKVSILVLTVIAIHIFCGAPYWTIQMITLTEVLSQSSRVLMHMSIIVQLLLFVNSSTNPILYAFLSKVFRASFKKVFYCCQTANVNQETKDANDSKRQYSSTPRLDYSPKKSEIMLSSKSATSSPNQIHLSNHNLVLSNRKSNGQLRITESCVFHEVGVSINYSDASNRSES